MSDPSDGKKNTPARPLLSLARWEDAEDFRDASWTEPSPVRHTGTVAADSTPQSANPLLAGLAHALEQQGAQRLRDDSRAAPRGPSLADLLHRRSEARGSARGDHASDDVSPAEPEFIPPPRTVLRRLAVGRDAEVAPVEEPARPPRASRGESGRPTPHSRPAEKRDLAAESSQSQRGGLFGALSRLVKRGDAKPASADDSPALPERPLPSRPGQERREVAPVAAPARVSSRHEKSRPEPESEAPARESLMSVIRRSGSAPTMAPASASTLAPASAPPAQPEPVARAMPEPSLRHSPAPPPSALPSPALRHPAPAAPAPAPPPAAASAPVAPGPMPAVPVAPHWHPAMPLQPLQPFYPAMPMAQPASAHFYWPQPAMPPHWAYAPPPPPAWQAPPPPAWQTQAPPEWQAPPLPAAALPVAPPQPAPAEALPPDAAPHPMPQASPPPQPRAEREPDPMTAEIDEVRERLRAFGETLHELRRTRVMPRAG